MSKERSLVVEKEDAYVALPTTEDEVVFAISVKENEPEDPQLMYDNDEHALVIRKNISVVILDYLNTEIQSMLQNSKKVYIAEIDYKEKRLKRDYEVPIALVEEYPIDLLPYFE